MFPHLRISRPLLLLAGHSICACPSRVRLLASRAESLLYRAHSSSLTRRPIRTNVLATTTARRPSPCTSGPQRCQRLLHRLRRNALSRLELLLRRGAHTTTRSCCHVYPS
ncbi:hypothetical protein C2E23DRAFT_812469 [Lenzites betulinus]|nr:hypothetical protein C2E23DRAFT_812469 [Lenzites betulinus]